MVLERGHLCLCMVCQVRMSDIAKLNLWTYFDKLLSKYQSDIERRLADIAY